MSPELRFAAQLNRLEREMLRALERYDELTLDFDEHLGDLHVASYSVRTVALALVRRAAEKGSRVSAAKPLVGGS